MKNVIAILFSLFTSYLFSQGNQIHDMMKKFSKDKIAYEQFRYFGELQCIDHRLDQDNNLLIYGYGAAYNSFYPFPRLINLESLKTTYNQYEALRIKKLGAVCFRNNEIENCTKLYRNNSTLKKAYKELVLDKNSYNIETNQYIIDFLENYFIRIKTD